MTERGSPGEKGRGRRGRPRPAVDESLPSPSALDIEIGEAISVLLTFRQQYRRDYVEGLSPPGGSGLGIIGNPTNATEATWASAEQRAIRAGCEAAVRQLRAALRSLRAAERAMRGPVIDQPMKPEPRAVVTPAEFDRALHRKRERELNRQLWRTP